MPCPYSLSPARMATVLFLLLTGLLLIASLYYLFTLYAAWRLFHEVSPPVDTLPPVSLFKPLKGGSPELYANLASFCRLEYPVFQLLCGVRDPQDPAVVVGAVLIMLLLGVTASAIPAMRALAVDPSKLLREE